MITPAISVLSAMEGLEVIAPGLKPFVLPLTIGILVALFAVQRWGTGGIARVFGPVMLVWFLTLGILGLLEVLRYPAVTAALGPRHALSFLSQNGWGGLAVLGAVFLVVTGAEALYADMGHFGSQPIRRAWFLIVLPALVLNYFGQGALLLRDPAAVDNPFYRLAAVEWRWPLILLATVATVIASQALITGVFSLSMQAMQLGYLPRMRLEHTSAEERGQIYMPGVNIGLLLACIGLVIGFGSSARLGAAYGVAVNVTMAITTALLFQVSRRVWRWPAILAAVVCGVFLSVELVFMGANCVKIAQGGWFPVLVGMLLLAVMTTWQSGRRILGQHLSTTILPLDQCLENLRSSPPARVPGTAVFLSGNPAGTPLALLHNLKHNQVLHERVVVLTLVTEDVPKIGVHQRLEVQDWGDGFWSVIGRYGFLQQPNALEVLGRCAKTQGWHDVDRAIFFLSRQTLLPGRRRGLAPWRKRLFAVLARNAQPATAFFKLPANRVVELGMQVEL